MIPEPLARPTVPATLPPFPNGWYALALSRELRRGDVRPMTFAGREIVLFRTASGAAAALDAYCPHLGAHMGYGGRVCGESLRCPFHGFRFDAAGACTGTSYGGPVPPLARAQAVVLEETHGLILAWHDGEGRSPGWQVPSLRTAGWSDWRIRSWTIRGHPQETTENSVDFGHFTQVHAYGAVEVLKEVEIDGPSLTGTYAMTRPAGRFSRPIRTEFDVHVHGLGYSQVDIRVPSYGVHARLLVLATPIDGRRITLRLGLSLREDTEVRRIHPLLALAPRPLVNAVIGRATLSGAVHDVEQDFVIWRHKRYVQPPILAQGDGPVGRYRRWARQFYPAHDAEAV
jgi:nitrite reductase/ring-hydroxylating ferredoxin subunit